MRHIVICCLSGSTVFFNIILQTTIAECLWTDCNALKSILKKKILQTARFSKKKYIEHEMCVFDILYNFCLKHFSFQEELGEQLSKVYIGLHVK
jgi:hypothetical protein